MAMRNRRRPAVVWLPPAADNRIAANPAITADAAGAGVFTVDIGGPAAFGDESVGVVPLVADLSSAGFQASNLPLESLADIFSSGYRLRRIVGNIFVEFNQTQGDTPVGALSRVLVTAGIIVLRVLPDGTALQGPDTYSPQHISNWSDPWIWRRTWILSNFVEDINAALTGGNSWPENNAIYLGTNSGPFVNQKTARVISNEERLFLVVSAKALNPSSNAATNVTRVYFDLRFVGSIRRMAGNRRNASR